MPLNFLMQFYTLLYSTYRRVFALVVALVFSRRMLSGPPWMGGAMHSGADCLKGITRNCLRVFILLLNISGSGQRRGVLL